MTGYEKKASRHGPAAVPAWWAVGMALAGAYFVYLFRSTRGKADAGAEGHGYT